MMLSHSNTFSIRATTGSHTPMASGHDEQQSQEARTPPTSPPGFATPISFVSEYATSEDLGYSPRKKLRSTSSSTDSQHITVPTLRSPASILASLDLSHVPKNEFILAIPSQVNSNWGIEYARPIMRRNNAFISRGDSVADPSTYSLNSVLLHGRKITGPPSSGLNRPMISTTTTTTTTTRSVFLPILDLDLEEDFSREEEVGYDDTTTDTTSVCGFRLKPRSRKLMEQPGTRPWDQEFSF
jgi:hypothetical protein